MGQSGVKSARIIAAPAPRAKSASAARRRDFDHGAGRGLRLYRLARGAPTLDALGCNAGGEQLGARVATPSFGGQVMGNWIKKFVRHYLLYGALLLVLCFGIFPFIVLYTSSMSLAEIVDRFSADKTHARRLDDLWTWVGKPYDYLVTTVG
jgi:hypothetical protein